MEFDFGRLLATPTSFICNNLDGPHFQYIYTLELKIFKNLWNWDGTRTLKTGLFAEFKNFAVLVPLQFLHYKKKFLHGSLFCINQPYYGWGQKF